MIIVNTSSQPFIALCLMLCGIVYSIPAFCGSKISANKILKNIIDCLLTITGAIVYFCVLYLINDGEMRIYTLACYLIGILIGFFATKRLSGIISSKANKNNSE